MITKKELYDFEEEVKKIFEEGQLRSPVHLSGSLDGNLEEFLIEYFKDNVKPEDWVFSTYRSHYHSLLKGVTKEELIEWIKDNKSIHFMSKKHKIFTSAIVGGTLPIALGVAMAIKRKGGKEKVHVFIGDMTASLGVFKDVEHYSFFHKLPMHFIIEDNELSTDTKTSEVWNMNMSDRLKILKDYSHDVSNGILSYVKYRRKYPHYGTGKFISKIWEEEDVKAKGF